MDALQRNSWQILALGGACAAVVVTVKACRRVRPRFVQTGRLRSQSQQARHQRGAPHRQVPPNLKGKALDRGSYTHKQFIDYFGDSEGHRLWAEAFLQPLRPGTKGYKFVSDKFFGAWRTETWHGKRVAPPQIKRVYFLDNIQERLDFVENITSESVEKFYFHGTRMECNFKGSPCGSTTCNACMIIKSSKFLLSRVGQGSGTSIYGAGLYFTSGSHSAKGYGLALGKMPPPQSDDFVSADAGNAVFLARVLSEHPEKLYVRGYKSYQRNDMMPPPDSSTYDSRVIHKDTGNDEIVLFSEDQVIPRYLIVF